MEEEARVLRGGSRALLMQIMEGAQGPSVAPAQQPCAACAAPQQRILYKRDAAGWNNVRIMFESLVAAASVTGRTLVLPPPSAVSHNPKLFHETAVYCMASLHGHAEFASSPAPPEEAPNVASLQELLRWHAEGRRALPADVILDPDSSRLSHFECLGLSGTAAARAARAVLALRLSTPYEDAAKAGLARLGLVPGAFLSVHLRRGDFATFRPETQHFGESLVARVREAFRSEDDALPVLVACSVAPEERDPFPELSLGLGARRRVARTDDAYAVGEGVLHRCIVDGLMLSMARRFVGTEDSTFSLGVWHLRAQARVARGSPSEPARTLDGVQSNAATTTAPCWQRATSFGALLE